MVSPGSLPTAKPFGFRGLNPKATRINIRRNVSTEELANFKADGNKFSILDEGFGQKQFWLDDAGLNFWTKSKLSGSYNINGTVPSSHNRFYRYLDGYDALDYGLKDIDILNQEFVLKSIHRIK